MVSLQTHVIPCFMDNYMIEGPSSVRYHQLYTMLGMKREGRLNWLEGNSISRIATILVDKR